MFLNPKFTRINYSVPQITYNTDVEVEEEVSIEEALDTLLNEPSYLVIYNDDYNTFDHVIDCLMTILGHTSIQSEQLTVLIHYKGKAVVKTAPLDVLKPLKDALIEKGLSAVIESEK